MGCFVGLVLIITTYINPCDVTHMYETVQEIEDDKKITYCTIVLRNESEIEIEAICSHVQNLIEQKRKYDR